MALDPLPEEVLPDQTEDETILEGYEQVYGSAIETVDVDGADIIEVSHTIEKVESSTANAIPRVVSISSKSESDVNKRVTEVKQRDEFEENSTSCSNKMDLREVQIKERKIAEDLIEAFDLYILDEHDTAEEISEGLGRISSLGVQYRHVHVELKSMMTDEEHKKAYGKYSEKCDLVRRYLKEARQQLKTLNKIKIDAENKKEESRQKRSALIEEQVFREKLEYELEHFEAKDIEESRSACARFEILLDEYYILLSRAKIVFGDGFERQCKSTFDSTLLRIRKQIKTCKSIISDFCHTRTEDITSKKEPNKQIIEKNLREAGILSEEIELRCKTLIDSCDTAKLSDLNDQQLVEKSKNVKEFDTEVREILRKFSEFSRIISSCGDDGDNLKEKTSTIQQNALKMKNMYTTELLQIVASRNSSERFRSLTIRVPKFKGYDSELDIYSFKSDFEKLIEPAIPKDYRVDILRRNYLAGPAYTLVENIENIPDIWEKLFVAYGNTKLLLQNKIAQLDKFESLEEINDDEKIARMLSQIINAMTELSALAKRFKLEYRLYVGGGLEKVLHLIGEDRQKSFLKNSMEKDNSVLSCSAENESEVFAEKLEWENLKEFLQKELQLRDNLTVLNKRKKCFGIKAISKRKQSTGDEDEEGSDSSAKVVECSPVTELSISKTSQEEEHKCHICGSLNHAASTDSKGKTYIEYFSCDRFVAMTPKERRITLQKHDFCLQCLSVGVRYDEKHLCFEKYVCPDEYHARFPKGLHVLVCETHKKNEENVELVEQYKKEFINNRYKNWNASKEQERLI